MTSEALKIQTYDNYVMKGGNKTLEEIEEYSKETLDMVGLDVSGSDFFNEIVILVLRKMQENQLD
tara:strand:+ start:1213 stop:1407 length:195 start_codon:yes stop_codon:yes gene_type:complete